MWYKTTAMSASSPKRAYCSICSSYFAVYSLYLEYIVYTLTFTLNITDNNSTTFNYVY